jgi:ribosomal protein L11 methyltransferase
VACPPQDWAGAWRAGLAPIVVSDELVVRPSFAAHALAPGQFEVVIDPGQAFGTGSHESTRLALELLAALPRSLRAGMRVLDVGTGSGVLALAALRLGAAAALGVDVDPVAVAVARENARANGLAARAEFVVGSLEALGPRPFDLVLANLLKRELLPLLPSLVKHVRPGARVLVSGILVAEGDFVREQLRAAGLGAVAARERIDASGTAWLGLDLSA